ncbi:hypothetical protein CSA56_11635 [candidate division KSB3 bacterium]|uniref:YacP-like NYN domain protein n=1 Tax=candidate division KSB3 bacterium TaxID=2044937 RepID=A0A2G6KCR6_9BACT|nr:MAG: hypothetical protein CSA56_11635 [candidate division KSB3 bacterium]
MSIIVDAYNYIGRSQELRLDDPSVRDKVIYLMGQYCAKVKKSVTLIFDGNYFVHHANRKRRYGRVTVIYTSSIYTADDAIKKMVKKQETRRRKSMLVVSSDREVFDYAQSHGTKVSLSEDFEQHLYRALDSPKKLDRVHIRLSEEEIKEWLKEFGPEPPDEKRAHRAAKKYAGLSPPFAKEPEPKPLTSSGKKQRSRKPSVTGRRDVNIDRENIHLTPQEVQEWLDIFGEDEEDR